MSGIFSAGGAGNVGVSGFYPVTINDSLRFNDDDSPALSKAYASAQTNTKKLTISVWVKRANLGIRTTILFANSGSAGKLSFQTTDKIYFNAFDTGYNGFESYELFRDTSAWYHIVAQADSAGQTGANINRVWVNGVELSNNKTSVFVPNNTDTMLLRNGVTTYIGDDTAGAYHFDGYLAEMNVIDGSIVAPTEFGETKDGVWIPKSYSGSYGTNGFHLEFNSNTNDTSGNSNNWTANNISAHDYLPDSPTNNFAVMNALESSVGTSVTLSEGNLKTVGSTLSYSGGVTSSFEQTSGKWYWEVYVNSEVTAGSNFYSFIGAATGENNLVHKSNNSQLPSVVAGINGWSWEGDGTINLIGTGTKAVSSVTAPSAGDVLGFAIDLDNGNVYFYHNGTAQNSGSPVITGVSDLLHNPMVGVYNGSTVTFNFGQDSTFAGATTAGGNSDANGVGDFKYAPPSGFLSLCSANLPEPTIISGAEHFNTVLWTGDATFPRNISGVGFDLSTDGGLVWIKNRSTTVSHTLWDSVRGAGANKELSPNNDTAEGALGALGTTADYGYISSLTSDGFDVAEGATGFESYVNASGNAYAAWNWKAGTSFSNSAGTNGATIASSGSVNTDAGFSIFTTTSNPTDTLQTYVHGLNQAPELVFIKTLDSSQGWLTYHKDNGFDKYMFLDDTIGATSLTDAFANVTDTVVQTRYFASQSDIVGYCWHSVAGYSKVGSYIGGGSNFPFVFTGFRPAWIMFKGATVASHWSMFDATRHPSNVNDLRLFANLTNGDDSAYALDLLSNGFKLRHTGSDFNTSGQTYIYLAFAESPAKYSNAR